MVTNTREIGYGYLIDEMRLDVTGYRSHAQIERNVTAVRRGESTVSVPIGVAPDSDDPMSHLEFAVRYQGVELEVLQAICSKLAPDQIERRLAASPNGKYLRIIASLFETFTGQTLHAAHITAPYANLFEPNEYICGKDRLQKRFRVNFNGIGDLNLNSAPSFDAPRCLSGCLRAMSSPSSMTSSSRPAGERTWGTRCN